ncbi:1-acylglycerol-3-phosphate O-acyltransferase Pnpla3-like [Amphibalanus amphitrite]|uniref:1-acylglycerol-3-phosphate O-acyltransferase Pnpla3-like n=1 Tax=Amphibalanus amphitrite TaxID=1232801 RepID=UPI001C909AC8|nr:1-acylglycerol-3-phosphate O-acyltransferase Pnpla3-like [Amphibalanus amphitrite]
MTLGGGDQRVVRRAAVVQFAAGSEPGPSRPRLPRRQLHSSASRPSVADKLSQMNLSFAGCGFLGVYHIGVAACMSRYCPELLQNRIAGASAGAIAAAALICNASLSEIMSDLVAVSRVIQDHIGGPFSPFVSVPVMLRAGLQKNLPDNAHELCSGRLHISVTRLEDGKNAILSHFESKDELITALLCTAFIPAFSGWRPPRFDGVRYMDGCYSNNLPTLDSRTITVSPFCGEADICPRDRTLSLIVIDAANTRIELTPENFMRVFMIMYPPSPETLSDLANQGFNDAIRFLMRHDLMKCQVCVMTTEIVGRAYSSCGRLIQHVHCDDCSHKQQEAMLARLPDAVHEPLHQNILRQRSMLRNWVLNFPGVRHLMVLAVPWTLPFGIIRQIYDRLVQRIPQLAFVLETIAGEVISAVHSGFSAHLPRSRQVHARYLCRLNLTEYGESAGLEEGQTQVPDVLDDGADAYIPGIVRRFDREFHVDFTNREHGLTVCTSTDAERLESEVMAAGIQVVDRQPAEEDAGAPVDRELVRMALEAQGSADCGVSWYYTDKDGNLCVRHVSAVPTPVATPCVSRRASICEDSDSVAAVQLLRRRAAAAAARDSDDSEDTESESMAEAEREESMTYDAGMGVIKEETNDPLPED